MTIAALGLHSMQHRVSGSRTSFSSSKGTSLRRLHRMGPLLGKDENGSRDGE